METQKEIKEGKRIKMTLCFMEIIFSKKAKNDLNFWQKSGNKVMLKKISELIRAIRKNPFEGIGKPEPLKHSLSGIWSRRINHEHCIIYQLTNEIYN